MAVLSYMASAVSASCGYIVLLFLQKLYDGSIDCKIETVPNGGPYTLKTCFNGHFVVKSLMKHSTTIARAICSLVYSVYICMYSVYIYMQISQQSTS